MSELADVNLSLVANVWIKMLDFKKTGDVVVTHQHTFDHQTLLAKGRLRVYRDDTGESREFTSPAIIVIEAGVNHCMESLDEGTVAYCIHALRSSEKAEDIIDPSQRVSIDHTHPLVHGLNNAELSRLA